MKLIKIDNQRLNLFFTHEELLAKKININKMLIDDETCNTYINTILTIIEENGASLYEKEELTFQIFPLIEGDLLVSVIKKDEEKSEFVYKFTDIEEIFFVFENFFALFSGFSSIYVYEKEYYLVLENCAKKEFAVCFILNEFSQKSLLNKAFLETYGKCLVSNNAQEIVFKYFLKG